VGADGTSTTPKLKIRLIYIGLHLKFYNPSLNNFKIYKLCITEIRVHLEEMAYNYQKRALGRSLSNHLAPQLPNPQRPGG